MFKTNSIPMFNNPAMRNRIGKAIAKAMEHRFSKP